MRLIMFAKVSLLITENYLFEIKYFRENYYENDNTTYSFSCFRLQ